MLRYSRTLLHPALLIGMGTLWDTVCALLEKYGFAVAKVADGESFGPVRGDSPRWIITAVKQYTQEEKANGTES